MCQGDVAADHLAIRALIDAYAHFADRREPEEQAALLIIDWTDTRSSQP